MTKISAATSMVMIAVSIVFMLHNQDFDNPFRNFLFIIHGFNISLWFNSDLAKHPALPK